jgi:hypothetical protein
MPRKHGGKSRVIPASDELFKQLGIGKMLGRSIQHNLAEKAIYGAYLSVGDHSQSLR